MKKIEWFIFLIAVQSILGLSGCRRTNYDSLSVPSSTLAAIETDPRYMKCEEFSGLEKVTGYPATQRGPLGALMAHNSDTEKIVILYSSSGSGHKSAADAVARALHGAEEQMLGKGRRYTIALVDVLYDLLPKKELFDEYMKDEEWGKLQKLVGMQGLAENLVSARQLFWDNKVLNRIMRACDDRPPTALISVFPIANYVYAKIAKKNNVPMVIVPTDFEISHFLNKINESNNQPADVFLALPGNEYEVIAPLHPRGQTKPIIPYCITGYPLRHEFIALRAKIDAAATRRHSAVLPEILKYRRTVLKVPKGRNSILITLGGKGGSLPLILQYLQKLNYMQEVSPKAVPLHVIIASGGDAEILNGLKEQAHTFRNNARFKTQVLGRLDAENMAMTMASVDAVLLKPGGSTVAEAIMLGTPMIIKSDSTAALPWERTNMALVKRMGWGVDLAPAHQLNVDTNDLMAKVKQVLAAGIRRNKTPFINFEKEFPKLFDAVQKRNVRGLDMPFPGPARSAPVCVQ